MNNNLRTFLLEIKDKRINTAVDVDSDGIIINITPMLKRYIGTSIFEVRDKLNGKLKETWR